MDLFLTPVLKAVAQIPMKHVQQLRFGGLHMKTEKDQKTECTGTARATHEMSVILHLEAKYGPEAAVGIATTAIRESFPQITPTQVEGALIVHKALLTGNVDVEKEKNRVDALSMAIVPELLETMMKAPVELEEDEMTTVWEDEES